MKEKMVCVKRALMAALLMGCCASWGADGVAYVNRQPKNMSVEQASGAASSYARKYAACGLFAIDSSENDPDRVNANMQDAKLQAEQRPQPKPRAKKPVRFSDTKLYKECVSLGVKAEGMEKWYGTQPFNDKTIDQLTSAEQKQVQTYLQDVRESIIEVSKK